MHAAEEFLALRDFYKKISRYDSDNWEHGQDASRNTSSQKQPKLRNCLLRARTAESMGQRDLCYSAQFGEFTRQLEAIADLEDLGQVRTASSAEGRRPEGMP
jgi:hypothetical protein